MWLRRGLMCGIVGAIDLSSKREFEANRLHAMMQAILHRGPDDKGSHTEPGLAMGVLRLAIVDVLKGHQPFCNTAKNIWTTVNGEIFDYVALRDILLEKGHLLKTRCDSEIWAHLYEEYGFELFPHINGQFALALWDQKAETLMLARDRLGICPLYYTEHDGWLLWASEIKALLAAGVPAQPDFKGIDYLFNFFSASTHRTFFEGIHLLPPGHYLKVVNGNISVKQYWDLDFPDKGSERRIDNTRYYVDEFESLLQKAVKKRLLSDVPIVSYLSGGIDSTMILNMSHRESGVAIPTFTMGLENIGPDERSASKETAKLFGSPLTTVPINAEKLVNAFPEFIESAEGPVLDTSCAALLLLAKEVHRQGYKVALTGEGADEALAGYMWFKTQKITQWMNGDIVRFFQKIFERTIRMGGRTHGVPIPNEGIANVRPAQQYMYEMVSLARETLYSEKMWENLRGFNPYADLKINHSRMKDWHPLNQSLYVGYKIMLPGLLLISKGDRVAMHSSVETRYPFLDEDVIDFCAKIDPSYKLRGMTEKWLLRKVAMKTLPEHIAKRKKKSFRTNLSDIFLGDAKPDWVDQLLSRESLLKTGYFHVDNVLREVALQKKLPRWLPRQLVFDAALACVISTQLWHHIFMGGGLCELPHR